MEFDIEKSSTAPNDWFPSSNDTIEIKTQLSERKSEKLSPSHLTNETTTDTSYGSNDIVENNLSISKSKTEPPVFKKPLMDSDDGYRNDSNSTLSDLHSIHSERGQKTSKVDKISSKSTVKLQKLASEVSFLKQQLERLKYTSITTLEEKLRLSQAEILALRQRNDDYRDRCHILESEINRLKLISTVSTESSSSFDRNVLTPASKSMLDRIRNQKQVSKDSDISSHSVTIGLEETEIEEERTWLQKKVKELRQEIMENEKKIVIQKDELATLKQLCSTDKKYSLLIKKQKKIINIESNSIPSTRLNFDHPENIDSYESLPHKQVEKSESMNVSFMNQLRSKDKIIIELSHEIKRLSELVNHTARHTNGEDKLVDMDSVSETSETNLISSEIKEDTYSEIVTTEINSRYQTSKVSVWRWICFIILLTIVTNTIWSRRKVLYAAMEILLFRRFKTR